MFHDTVHQLGTEIGLARAWVATRAAPARRRVSRSGGDRGEILQTVVIIAAFVALAIVIVGIIAAKATSAAQNIKTQ